MNKTLKKGLEWILVAALAGTAVYAVKAFPEKGLDVKDLKAPFEQAQSSVPAFVGDAATSLCSSFAESVSTTCEGWRLVGIVDGPQGIKTYVIATKHATPEGSAEAAWKLYIQNGALLGYE